jgi:hypothetical protein
MKRPYTGDAKVLSCLNHLVHFARKSARDDNREFNINKHYLLKIYKLQKGRCAYTCNKLFIITERARQKLKLNHYPYKMSLDRIDPSEGYIKGNVQLVTYRFNRIKSDLHNSELFRMFRAVANRNAQKRYTYLINKITQAV